MTIGREEIPEDILRKTKRISSVKGLAGAPISDVVDVVDWWWEHSSNINHPIFRHGVKSLSFLTDVNDENIIITLNKSKNKLDEVL